MYDGDRDCDLLYFTLKPKGFLLNSIKKNNINKNSYLTLNPKGFWLYSIKNNSIKKKQLPHAEVKKACGLNVEARLNHELLP
jgi:hypothetical protein